MKPRNLYVHVPFCARRCGYCDFAVQAVRVAPAWAWLNAVLREFSGVARAEAWAEPLELSTIYIGGGTPSLLGPGVMAALGSGLRRFARWGPDEVEWTAEANPESLGAALARDWRDAGVNRVSLGVQSFQETVLRWMGRLHGSEGAVRAVRSARAGGIRNVSVDLIFGLPRRLGRRWAEELDRVLALEPEHISLYGLTAEPATPLGRWVAEGRERLPAEDEYAEEYLLAAERLTEAGFHHYEVSNFARPGYESRHNTSYWSGAAYLGLGSGAHSFLPPERRWNTREWDAYREAILARGDAVAGRETLDAEAARLERLWLGLRVAAGLDEETLDDGQRRLARRWRAQGWARLEGGALRLTPAGWLLLDRLAVELEAASEPAPLDAAPAGSTHSTAAGLSESGTGNERSTAQ